MRQKLSMAVIAGAVVVLATNGGVAPVERAHAAQCLHPMSSPVTVAGTIEQYSSTDNAVLIATPAIKQCDSQEIIVPLAGTNEDCRIGQILVATGMLVRSGGYLRLEGARDISCRERR